MRRYLLSLAALLGLLPFQFGGCNDDDVSEDNSPPPPPPPSPPSPLVVDPMLPDQGSGEMFVRCGEDWHPDGGANNPPFSTYVTAHDRGQDSKSPDPLALDAIRFLEVNFSCQDQGSPEALEYHPQQLIGLMSIDGTGDRSDIDSTTVLTAINGAISAWQRPQMDWSLSSEFAYQLSTIEGDGVSSISVRRDVRRPASDQFVRGEAKRHVPGGTGDNFEVDILLYTQLEMAPPPTGHPYDIWSGGWHPNDDSIYYLSWLAGPAPGDYLTGVAPDDLRMADPRWSAASLDTVLRHELGHAMGLHHADLPEMVMSPIVFGGAPPKSPTRAECEAMVFIYRTTPAGSLLTACTN